MNLLEGNIGSKLCDMGVGDSFLEIICKVQATKSKINKWDYIKLKSLCTAKESEKTTLELTGINMSHYND